MTADTVIKALVLARKRKTTAHKVKATILLDRYLDQVQAAGGNREYAKRALNAHATRRLNLGQ